MVVGGSRLASLGGLQSHRPEIALLPRCVSALARVVVELFNLGSGKEKSAQASRECGVLGFRLAGQNRTVVAMAEHIPNHRPDVIGLGPTLGKCSGV